jgi:hypothetical protein
MESDPGQAVRFGDSCQDPASLPASMQQHVEEETHIVGTLEAVHEDNASGGR